VFLRQAAGIGSLPDVSFLDPNFGVTGHAFENDEHLPTDIQRGQAYVSRVVNAVRRGPYWKDSIIIIAYDEHGGFYDHARPPRALQGGTLNPDGSTLVNARICRFRLSASNPAAVRSVPGTLRARPTPL
jgi:phospholipase C